MNAKFIFQEDGGDILVGEGQERYFQPLGVCLKINVENITPRLSWEPAGYEPHSKILSGSAQIVRDNVSILARRYISPKQKLPFSIAPYRDVMNGDGTPADAAWTSIVGFLPGNLRDGGGFYLHVVMPQNVFDEILAAYKADKIDYLDIRFAGGLWMKRADYDEMRSRYSGGAQTDPELRNSPISWHLGPDKKGKVDWPRALGKVESLHLVQKNIVLSLSSETAEI